ncbi:diguanylate cyclase domain-containing protein [Pseudoalteromonas mariniglutinosa]|uniref:diguanylate cyclase domain-containing protein n=1 Tax=Pseudoalteromonas mariniglutinosa TaxID=206042 RepID=UPI00384E4E6E
MLLPKQLMQVIEIQTEIAKLGLDLGAVMQYVVEQIQPLMGADSAAIELAEDDEMVYRAASGTAKGLLGLRLKIDTSLSGLCVKTGEVLDCADSEVDPRVDRTACQQVGLRSMIVIPLKHREVTVGVLKAMSAQPNYFQQSDIILLNMLSEVIAAAMYFSVKYDSEALFFKATHDAMTGLANRALFMDRLRNAIACSIREKSLYGILMIDIDGLKLINDTHGHRIGDAVISEFARRLKSAIRDMDTAARLGGDEFGVIVTALDNPKGMKLTIQRIDLEIARPFMFERNEYQLKASIGFALIQQDGIDPTQLLEIADQRMYAVKRSRQ